MGRLHDLLRLKLNTKKTCKMPQDLEIVKQLARKAIALSGSSSSELERNCWRTVHEYRHGVAPVEYDIREIDENLYLNVLNYAKSSSQ